VCSSIGKVHAAVTRGWLDRAGSGANHLQNFGLVEEKKVVRLKQEMNTLTSLSVSGAAAYKFVVTSRQRCW
jgi:hypothetical protein